MEKEELRNQYIKKIRSIAQRAYEDGVFSKEEIKQIDLVLLYDLYKEG